MQHALCFVLALASMAGVVCGQDASVFVKPTNYFGRAPDYSRDAVNLIISELVISKKKGILAEDSSVAIYAVTKLIGTQGRTFQESRVHQIYKTRINDYDEGTVSLPVELNI